MSLRASVQPGTSKRTDFPLIPSKACLLIIDVQKYVTPETTTTTLDDQPTFYQQSTTTMCQNIPRLLKTFRTCRDSVQTTTGCEVVFTYLQSLTHDRRDISWDYKLSGPELSGIPPPSASLDELFLTSIMPHVGNGNVRGDILIPKTSCSVFVSTHLDYVLRNLQVEQLVVCGQLTDQCVESAVRDAADLGYFVTVVSDACAAKSLQAEQKGHMGMSGFCRFRSTDQILEEVATSSSPMEGKDDNSIQNNPLTAAPAPVVPSSVSAASPVKNLGIRIQQKQAASMSFEDQNKAYTQALLYALQAAGVEFLRYLMIDVCNTVRCKMAPINQLLRKGDLRNQIALAKVVTAGLPSFADGVMEGTGLDAASGAVILQPDVTTLRILPYAPQSALVLGTLQDGGSEEVSQVCTRGLLQKVVTTARDEFKLRNFTGMESTGTAALL